MYDHAIVYSMFLYQTCIHVNVCSNSMMHVDSMSVIHMHNKAIIFDNTTCTLDK